MGKIGTIMHLKRADAKNGTKLDGMASQLAMHIAAMKPVYEKQDMIPDDVK